jgi:pimeloyl-ACP methyl ester carboxylesterase
VAQYNINHSRALANALSKEGIAVWNLEYRKVGDPNGGWPGTFDDVARGTDHLRKIAHKYRLDLNRVVTIGHSSGGHLALWLAGRAKLPQTSELYMKNPLQLKGVVDLDGPGVLKAALPMQQSVCGAPVIPQLLGGTPAERPERYRQTSPIEMLPLGVRQEFFAGRMFASQAPVYEEAAKRSPDSVIIFTMPAYIGYCTRTSSTCRSSSFLSGFSITHCTRVLDGMTSRSRRVQHPM